MYIYIYTYIFMYVYVFVYINIYICKFVFIRGGRAHLHARVDHGGLDERGRGVVARGRGRHRVVEAILNQSSAIRFQISRIGPCKRRHARTS